MPCLILLALCGLLVSQKSDSKKSSTSAPATAPQNLTPEKFPPLPALPPPTPVVVAEAAPEEMAAPEFSTPDEVISSLTATDEAERTAARTAAVQSGDRNFIPSLQSAAERMADAHEKSALLDAAEFLGLPTLAEAGH